MAAVGLSKETISKILPPNVVIACQNGKQIVTISGLESPVRTFVRKLQSEGVFAKIVNTSNIAFHSEYTTTAGNVLRQFLNTIITKPTPRTSKWISTSVPDNQQNEDWAKLNCAEYHVNNFENTVLFDEVYKHIPDNAIVIEVAPHGILQAILKRELNSNVTCISLSDKNSADNELFFLSSVGK